MKETGYLVVDLVNDKIRWYFTAESNKAAIKWAKLYYNLNDGQYILVKEVNIKY
jgi:hypothetical protein